MLSLFNLQLKDFFDTLHLRLDKKGDSAWYGVKGFTVKNSFASK